MKLACVVHRFGAGIAGGSEGHCRAIALRLAGRHHVTILTSTARDHVTWAEAFPAGRSADGPLQVERFPVVRTRSIQRFAMATEVATSGTASEQEQEAWFRENGPEVPALLDHLRSRGGDYDRVLFWSFRYYQSYFGLPIVAPRSVLVPTAEDDPVIRFDILDRYFQQPAGFLFLTPEEHALVARRCSRPLAPFRVIGTGLDDAPVAPPPGVLAEQGLSGPFVLYLGRIDPNKGCETLLHDYLQWQQAAPGDRRAPLVMAGPANMPVPKHPMVRHLGYVDDEVREALLANASALVVSSPYESLSLVLLEAWNHGTPALVNGRCEVLRGQALRSKGALFYRDSDEFGKGLDWLLTHSAEARVMGRQGLAYVDREYRWPRVIAAIDDLLASS